MLDNVYGLTLGIETSMLPLWGKATSIQLEASALSPWIYVHRGACTSFNEKGHVIGNENGGDLREGQLRFNIEWSKQLKLLIGGSVIQTGATNGDWLWQAEESNGLSWPISPTRKRATGQLAFEYSIGKKSGLQGYLQVEKGQGLTEARLALRMGESACLVRFRLSAVADFFSAPAPKGFCPVRLPFQRRATGLCCPANHGCLCPWHLRSLSLSA